MLKETAGNSVYYAKVVTKTLNVSVRLMLFRMRILKMNQICVFVVSNLPVQAILVAH